jgi:hypothetical protein
MRTACRHGRALSWVLSIILGNMCLMTANAPAAPSAQVADSLDRFLDQLSSCVSSRAITLAVAGFSNDETSLSRAQADEIRYVIETRLQGSGRVRLAAAADVMRIRSLREGTTGLAPADGEQQIRNAFDGDASVFFVGPSRNEKAVTFRLQAITRNAGCKATSEPIEVAVKSGAAISDTDKIMSAAVERLFGSARDTTELAVCPFSGVENSHSTCAGALTDRLMLALDAKARDPSRVLSERKLAVRRLPAGACAVPGEGVVAQGSFDHDRQGQSWVNLEFRRGTEILAPTGKTRISVEGLGCDPVLRPFLDHVAASARTNHTKLDVAAVGAPFLSGQRLDVRIEAKVALKLYCWVLAPDETAFVVLPTEDDEAKASVKPGTARYPSSFNLNEIVLQEKFENLFSCYGVEGDLPASLHRRWTDFGPSANRDAKVIPRSEVHGLMEAMRSSGVAAEATTRIVVK